MDEPFEHAVRRHGPTVLRVCRAVLGSDAEAEDAWSETFLAALRAWPQLPADTNVEAWLVRVAHHKSVDVVRRRVRQAAPVGVHAHADEGRRRGEDVTVGAAGGGGVSAGSAAHDDALDLWQAVSALPERQRLAVAHHFLGGLPHAQTAELIGSTPAAVRRASADGVAALRRHLTAGATTTDEGVRRGA